MQLHIAGVSRFMLAVTIIFTVFYVKTTFGGLLNFAFLKQELMVKNIHTAAGVDMGMRILWFAVWLPPLVFGTIACISAVLVSYWCQAGKHFSPLTADGIVVMGTAIATGMALQFFAESVSVMILTWKSPLFTVGFQFHPSLYEIEVFMFGLGFILVGLLFREAIRISEENASFV